MNKNKFRKILKGLSEASDEQLEQVLRVLGETKSTFCNYCNCPCNSKFCCFACERAFEVQSYAMYG